VRTLGSGEIVAGRFRLDRWAGAGAFGTVFRAQDLTTGGFVALKLLDKLGPEVAARFAREARIIARIEHGAVVRYVAHGATNEDLHFLAIEWLEGEDLSARLRKGPLSLVDAVALTRALAGGLAAAHSAGVVHRDLKPANVFLVGGDAARPKILDFGVSHLASATVALTHDGAIVGTPGYMAPEQARGEDVGPAADLFALGCLLYEALAGRPAFRGRGALELMAKVVLEPTPRVRDFRPETPAVIEALLDRMLAKNAAARPASAGEVERALTLVDGLEATIDSTARAGRAIGADEQALMSIIMATPHAGGGDDASTARTVDQAPAAAEISAAARVAHEHGFTVARLAGESMLASLQRGGAATDLATRAARTALAMRVVAPSIGIVLATGRARAGEAIPIGDVIDGAASALRRTPMGGDIVVDELTADLLERTFEVASTDGTRVLRGELGSRDVVRRLCGLPTPCVGRDRELASLAALWDECTGEPAARAVLVVGPPGAGKSRLRYELLRTVATAATLLHGQSDPVNAGEPFGLLAGAIRRAGPLPDVPENVALFLGEMLGLPRDDVPPLLAAARANAAVMADQIRAAWGDYLRAALEAGPVLIILEDLHWGDLPSVNLIDSVLRVLRDRPLFVLAMARPEVHDRYPDLWASHDRQDLRLTPLGKRAAEQLIRSVLPDASAELVATLVEHAGGNAFFLEELIRSAALGRTGGFPPTAVAMAQARIDALGDESRRVLRAAAILGQTFWDGAVAALLDAGEGLARDDVDACLERLADDEIVTRRRQSRLAGQREMTFRHALVREAAYATLTDADRELGHRLAADWLEAIGDRDAVALAEHCTRGGQPVRAIPWLHRAAEQALEGNDYVATLERVERARRAGASGATRGALELLAAEAHKWRGEWAAQAAAGVTAMSSLEAGSVPWCDAVAATAFGAGRSANRALVASLSNDLGAIDGPPSPARATACVFVAIEARYVGLLAQAEALFHRADVESASFPDDHLLAGTIQRAQAFRARFAGDMASAATHHDLASQAYSRAGALRQSCQERYNVADAVSQLGAADRAEAALDDVLAECARRGLDSIQPYALGALGLVRYVQGRFDDARETLERAIVAFSVGGGNRRGEQSARETLARVHLASGDLVRAEEEAKRAIEMAAAVVITATAEATLARIEVAAGRLDAGLARARAANTQIAAQGGSEDVYIPASVAAVLLAAGHDAEARVLVQTTFRRVLELAARIGDTGLRRSFVEHVPENAMVCDLATRLGIDGTVDGGGDPR
jgi:eukaryotic-like serine/threonine-protein kinase